MSFKTPEYSVGDLVRLKCGGPPMVVVRRLRNHSRSKFRYRCAWHVSCGDIVKRTLPEASLISTIAPPDQSIPVSVGPPGPVAA